MTEHTLLQTLNTLDFLEVAPPIQHADTDEEKFQPSLELYGQKMATPTSPTPRRQEGQASVQELAYEQTPSRTMVTTNPTPERFHQEVHPQVEQQGRTKTTITPGQPKFPSHHVNSSSLMFRFLLSSDSKTVMSWDPRASVQGSTSGMVGSYTSKNVFTDSC
jgi:hypothetical protein